MKPRTLNNQDGIALGPILFIIAILAIIAAVISAGRGGFTANTNTENAKTIAQVLIDYGEQVQSGVDAVTANGCTDTQINFANTIITGYTNLNAPADHSCDVFNTAGGGINFKLLTSTPPIPIRCLRQPQSRVWGRLYIRNKFSGVLRNYDGCIWANVANMHDYQSIA